MRPRVAGYEHGTSALLLRLSRRTPCLSILSAAPLLATTLLPRSLSVPASAAHLLATCLHIHTPQTMQGTDPHISADSCSHKPTPHSCVVLKTRDSCLTTRSLPFTNSGTEGEPEERRRLRAARLADKHAKMKAALAEKVAREEEESRRRAEQVQCACVILLVLH